METRTETRLHEPAEGTRYGSGVMAFCAGCGERIMWGGEQVGERVSATGVTVPIYNETAWRGDGNRTTCSGGSA